MSVLLIGAIFVVVGTGAVALLRAAQNFSDANEVIPGHPTRAPKGWAGAHIPEARLHRRLRDAMTSLAAHGSLDSADLSEVRSALEQAALGVDDRLVAVASMRTRNKPALIEQCTLAVEAIEAAVSDVVLLHGLGPVDVSRAIAQVRTRVALVEQARAELSAYDPEAG